MPTPTAIQPAGRPFGVSNRPPKGVGAVAQSTNPTSKGTRDQLESGGQSALTRKNLSSTSAGGAQQRGRSESMAQAVAGNRIPKGTAMVPIDMLLQYGQLQQPSKNPSFGEQFWGTEAGSVGAALRVAGASVQPTDGRSARKNPDFHYEAKSGSLYFADSAAGAQAYVDFMAKFTDLTTDRNGNYTAAAQKFVEQGLPLLTEQFGPKLIGGLEQIEKNSVATQNAPAVRFLTNMQRLGDVVDALGGVVGQARTPGRAGRTSTQNTAFATSPTTMTGKIRGTASKQIPNNLDVTRSSLPSKRLAGATEGTVVTPVKVRPRQASTTPPVVPGQNANTSAIKTVPAGSSRTPVPAVAPIPSINQRPVPVKTFRVVSLVNSANQVNAVSFIGGKSSFGPTRIPDGPWKPSQFTTSTRTGAGTTNATPGQATDSTRQNNQAGTPTQPDDADHIKLNAAVGNTAALSSGRRNGAGTSAQPTPLDPDPPGALVHQPKDIQIPAVDSALNKRIAGSRPVTEAQRHRAVQNIMDYPGQSVTTRRDTVESWADDAARNLRETAGSLGFTPDQVPPPYQNLTRSELAAVQFWTGRGFRPAKASLLEPRQISESQSKYGAGDGAYVRSAGQYANVLDDTLAKLPKVRGTFIRHDTVSSELLAKYKVNSTVEWPAFSSASADTGVFTTRNCRFEIEGNPVDLRGFNPWEREVMFRPGSRFTVLSIDASTTDPGKTVIKLKQIE